MLLLRSKADPRLYICACVLKASNRMTRFGSWSSNSLAASPQNGTKNYLRRSGIKHPPSAPTSRALCDQSRTQYWNPLFKILDPPLLIASLFLQKAYLAAVPAFLATAMQCIKLITILYWDKTVFREELPYTAPPPRGLGLLPGPKIGG